jgi:prophage regulatory protein
MQTTITRPANIKQAIGIGKTLAYAKIQPGNKAYDPTFPLPVRLSSRAVGWRTDELQTWLDSRQRGGSK